MCIIMIFAFIALMLLFAVTKCLGNCFHRFPYKFHTDHYENMPMKYIEFSEAVKFEAILIFFLVFAQKTLIVGSGYKLEQH